MDKPIENFWQIRLADVKTALEANNFEVFLAQKKEDVHKKRRMCTKSSWRILFHN
jgi:hypothetical protein